MCKTVDSVYQATVFTCHFKYFFNITNQQKELNCIVDIQSLAKIMLIMLKALMGTFKFLVLAESYVSGVDL